MKTLESIARVFPSLSPENQKTAADALGLDANGLQLLREGARLKELLAKSDQFGLTMDPALNDQLKDMNGTLNEVSASWDGLKKKMSAGMLLGSLNKIDGSVKDGLEGITDLFSHGDLLASLMRSVLSAAIMPKSCDVFREIKTCTAACPGWSAGRWMPDFILTPCAGATMPAMVQLTRRHSCRRI